MHNTEPSNIHHKVGIFIGQGHFNSIFIIFIYLHGFKYRSTMLILINKNISLHVHISLDFTGVRVQLMNFCQNNEIKYIYFQIIEMSR